MKTGISTCLALGAVCLLSAAVVFTSRKEDVKALKDNIRGSITLYDNKKMYADAVEQYQKLINADPSDYGNIIEYRDYCKVHEFEKECAQACQTAIQLKAADGKTDYESSKIYLQWLESSGSKDVYKFVKECINKFSGEEKQYFSDIYDGIKGRYSSFGNRYVNFSDWHNNLVYSNSKYYYGNEYYTIAEDRDGNFSVVSSKGEAMFTAPEIMSYSAGKNVVAAHHEDQLVYLNVSQQRKIVPYNAKENKLLDYDYLGAYYNNIANFSVGGKWGYINGNADIITDRYEYATPFVNNIAAVKENGTWQFITIMDNTIAALSDERFTDVKLDEYGCPFSYGFAYVKKTGSDKWSLISEVVSEEERRITGIKHVGDLEFDDVKPFAVYGAAKLSDKWGFVDAEGKWALEPTFDDAGSMACGLAPVKAGELWGYADITGKLIIKAQFENAAPFNTNGCAATCEGGVWRMIRLAEYAE